MKEKCVTFCFLELEATSFLKSSYGGLGLFFQSYHLLTLFLTEAVAMK